LTDKFNGFQDSDADFTGIPDVFFREVLPSIYDLLELKICLYVLWKAKTLGDFGLPITTASVMEDGILMRSFPADSDEQEQTVLEALTSAVRDKILVGPLKSEDAENVFFINSPRGRKAAQKHAGEFDIPNITLDLVQPNIFQLYEENIGPLTPLIADELRDAEESYPHPWISEAIQIAVNNNVRRWNYVRSILERWQKEGRDGTDRKNTQEDHRRYLKGEYGEIGHH